MAFSAAGIQTGTDTDLTGLTSITGVTSATDGNVVTYTVPSTFTDSIEIRGTLSHNTELERIVFQRPLNGQTPPPMIWINGGTYNYGIEKVPGIFTDGVGIQFNGGGDNWYNGGFNNDERGTHIAVGTSGTNPLTNVSTLNINGGRIAGQFHMTMRPNGVLNNVYGAKFLVDQSTQAVGQEWLSRFYGGTFNADNFAYEGGSISIGNGSGGGTLSFDRANAGLAYWPQHANGNPFDATDVDSYPTLQNVTFTGNTVDIAPWQNGSTNIGGTRVQNCGNGSNININGGETSSAGMPNNVGYVWVTRQIETNFRALADQSNVDATIRMFDTNRQANLSSPTASLATGAISYTGQTDGTLTSWTAAGTGTGVTSINTEAENEVALAFWSLVHNGTARARGTIDNGLWAMDRRSEGGVIGVDDFIFYTYAYGFNPIVTNADLAGTGILTLSENFIADANITEPVEATALAYTGITTTNQSVVVSADRTLDQLYDKAMADKVNNNTLSNNDTVVQDWLFSDTSGNTLSLDGTKTISVGANVLSAGTTHQTLNTNTTVIIDGTGFNGITFDGTTGGNVSASGDFGAISNGANITTTNPDLQEVASVHTSSIDSVGAITVTGDVTIGDVESDGNVIVNGDVTAVDPEVAVSSLVSGGSTIVAGSISDFSTITAQQAILVQTNATDATLTASTSTVGVTGNSTRSNIDGTSISIGGTSTNDDIDATAAATVTGNVDGSDIKAVGLVALGANITNLAKVDTDGNITVAGNANDVTLDGANISTTGTSTEVTYIASGNVALTGASTGGTITASGTTAVGAITDGEVTSVGTYTGTGAQTDTDVTVTGANNDITLNNQTVTNGTFISPDNISLSNGTSNGATFLALDNIQLAGSTSRHTDSTFRGDAVNNVVATTFVSGNTFGPATDGSNININLNIGSDTSTNLNTLLGTGWTFTSNGVATIRNTGSGTVTISVSEDDLTALGITLAAGSSTAEADGIVYNRPAAAAEPRTFGITAPKAGNLRYKVMGADGIGTLVDGNTAGAVIDTDNNDSSTYAIWWKPDSDVGEIYDYTYQEWSPMTQASTTIGDFQPDPASAITGNATELNFVATFSQSFDATSGEARFIITSADTAYMNAGLNQTLAWKMMNEDEYLQAVVNGNQTAAAADRLINFGSGTVGPTTGFVNDLIRVSSTTGQKSINGWSGFLTDVAGTDPDTFDTIISTSTNILFGSDAQISALAGGDAITSLGDELKANQSNLKESIESNPYVAASALPFNTAD